jgi:hypothetical protein
MSAANESASKVNVKSCAGESASVAFTVNVRLSNSLTVTSDIVANTGAVFNSVSQCTPPNNKPQLQEYESTPSTHVPPFKQGLDKQSSTFVSHDTPVQPDAQLQV